MLAQARSTVLPGSGLTSDVTKEFGMNIEKTLILVLIIALVVVGPTQLPKLAKMFGKSAKALRDGMEGKDTEEEPTPAPKPKAKADDEDTSGEA
jgi:sec-independent protein translocase protein TatA